MHHFALIYGVEHHSPTRLNLGHSSDIKCKDLGYLLRPSEEFVDKQRRHDHPKSAIQHRVNLKPISTNQNTKEKTWSKRFNEIRQLAYVLEV